MHAEVDSILNRGNAHDRRADGVFCASKMKARQATTQGDRRLKKSYDIGIGTLNLVSRHESVPSAHAKSFRP